MGSMNDQDHVWVGQAALILRDGKFLMMKRAGKHGAGTWSVPGGWQELLKSEFIDNLKQELERSKS